MITANCSLNSTWNTLDMSQCTFRNNVPVMALVVMEVLSDSAIQKKTLEVHTYIHPSHEYMEVNLLIMSKDFVYLFYSVDLFVFPHCSLET